MSRGLGNSRAIHNTMDVMFFFNFALFYESSSGQVDLKFSGFALLGMLYSPMRKRIFAQPKKKGFLSASPSFFLSFFLFSFLFLFHFFLFFASFCFGCLCKLMHVVCVCVCLCVLLCFLHLRVFFFGFLCFASSRYLSSETEEVTCQEILKIEKSSRGVVCLCSEGVC